MREKNIESILYIKLIVDKMEETDTLKFTYSVGYNG